MSSPPPILTLTDAARAQARHLLAKAQGANVHGLRVGVRSRGCSGLRYYVEYAQKRAESDQPVAGSDPPLFVDAKSVLFLIGSEMDWEDTPLRSGFTFRNPNETARCGCGESFSVDQAPASPQP